MSRLKVMCYSISVDGYGAGPEQSLENPMGIGGMALHEWVFPTKSFKAMHSQMTGSAETAEASLFSESVQEIQYQPSELWK